MCHKDAIARPTPTGEALLDTWLEWNPEAELRVMTRWHGNQLVVDDTAIRVRDGCIRSLDRIQSELARAYAGPCHGRRLVELADKADSAPTAVVAALGGLVDLEVLFAP